MHATAIMFEPLTALYPTAARADFYDGQGLYTLGRQYKASTENHTYENKKNQNMMA
jgi:hypothetical protein